MIGVLSALVLPSLWGARRGARELATTSNLRHHAMILGVYTSENKDLYPCLTDPSATYSVIRCQSAGIAIEARYFGAAVYWWVGLADGYYEGAWRSPVFRSPLLRRDQAAFTYRLPCSFLADPAFYVPETRQPPPAQLRGVRATEVQWPEKKSLVVDAWRLFEPSAAAAPDARTPAGFVDGHAEAVPESKQVPQYRIGDGPYPLYDADYPAFIPMTHTVGGVRGRDKQ